MNYSEQSKLIYFDNAATTFPKPQSVIQATLDCMQNYCGNAGRGSHPIAMRSAEEVYSAREAVASLFGGEPDQGNYGARRAYSHKQYGTQLCSAPHSTIGAGR